MDPEFGSKSANVWAVFFIMWWGVCIVLSAVTLALWKFVSDQEFRPSGLTVRTAAQKMYAVCSCCGIKDSRIRGLVRQRFRRRTEQVIPWAVLVFTCSLVLSLLPHKSGLLLQTSVSRAEIFLTDGSFVLTAVILIPPLLLGAAVPKLLTQRFLDSCHALTLVRFIWQLASSHDAEQHLYISGYWNPLRMCIAAFAGNPPLTIALNTLYTAADIIIMQQHTFTSSRFAFNYWQRELCALVEISLVSMLVFSSIATEASLTFEAKISAGIEVTLDRILSALCDAVVHLRPNLSIRYPSPKLAGLLLRPLTDGMLQGDSFLELLNSGADRDRVQQHLGGGVDLGSVPRALNVSIRDVVGNLVPVEFIYSSYTDTDDQTSYIVGIREIGDLQRMPNPPDLALVDAGELLDVVPEPSIPSSSSGTNVPWQESEGETGVWFASSEDGFPILKCTPEFTELAGPLSSSTKFLNFVFHKSEFELWVQTTSNALYFGDAVHPTRLDVKLQLPREGVSKRVLKADVTVEIPEDKQPSGESQSEVDLRFFNDDRFVLFLKLTNIRNVRTKRSRASSLQGTGARSTSMDITTASQISSSRTRARQDLVAWCNAETINLKVIRCSAELARLVGNSVLRSGLLDIVAEPDDFMVWFQMNRPHEGSVCSSIIACTEVSLLLPSECDNVTRLFHGTCRLTFEELAQQAAEDPSPGIPMRTPSVKGLVARLAFDCRRSL